MSVSHWGVFPGLFALVPALDRSYPIVRGASRWVPLDFDTWCSYTHMYGSAGQ